MKIRKNMRKGFTLVEVLVVIAILAILTAASWAAYGYYQGYRLNKLAETQIKVLADGVNAYKESNGQYPPGKGDEMSSNYLYMALTSDYDNDGKTDVVSGSSKPTYCRQLSEMGIGDSAPVDSIPYRKVQVQGKNVYVILDPWERAYRYRLGWEQSVAAATEKFNRNKGKGTKADREGRGNTGTRTNKNKGEKGSGLNTDFDIFSLGEDGLGDCKKKSGGDDDDNISNIVW